MKELENIPEPTQNFLDSDGKGLIQILFTKENVEG